MASLDLVIIVAVAAPLSGRQMILRGGVGRVVDGLTDVNRCAGISSTRLHVVSTAATIF
jgi:hypothetical protein